MELCNNRFDDNQRENNPTIEELSQSVDLEKFQHMEVISMGSQSTFISS